MRDPLCEHRALLNTLPRHVAGSVIHHIEAAVALRQIKERDAEGE